MAVNYSYDAYETTIERTDKNVDNSAKMWNGYSDGPVQENYTTYFRTFNTWVPSEWTITEVGAGTQGMVDEAGGAILLTNAAADNDAIEMQHGKGSDGTGGEWVLPAANKNIYFEVKCKISDATQSDMFVGLTTTDTAIIASYPTNLIGFRKDDGDTNIDCVNNSTETVAVATMGTGYRKYGFKVTGLTKIEYYIDDALVATHTTNIPTTEMRPSICIQNGEAVAKTMTVKYIKVAAQN